MSAGKRSSANLSPEDKLYVDTWKEVGQPTEHHNRLSALKGDWDFVTKWYREPGAEPLESKGSTSLKSVFGGRFLEEQARGQLLNQDDYQARSVIGYDFRKKKYFTAYYDNFQTSLIVSEGDWPEGSDTISLKSSHHVDTLSGAHDGSGAEVKIKIISPAKRTIQILEWDKDGRKQYVATEIEYTRAGGA